MRVDSCRVGPIMTNCYAVHDDSSCILVDPGDEAQAILGMLDGRAPDLVVITHPHFDHVGALAEIVRLTAAPVAAFASAEQELVGPPDSNLAPRMQVEPIEKLDMPLTDGQLIELGETSWKVIHTPGHHPASICLYNEANSILMSGDTLFRGTCGRTDFPGGDRAKMRDSLRMLAQLPSETKVYPGHEGFTTIGKERNWIERL